MKRLKFDKYWYREHDTYFNEAVVDFYFLLEKATYINRMKVKYVIVGKEKTFQVDVNVIVRCLEVEGGEVDDRHPRGNKPFGNWYRKVGLARELTGSYVKLTPS